MTVAARPVLGPMDVAADRVEATLTRLAAQPQRPLFSHRYGLRETSAHGHLGTRHAHHGEVEGCERDTRLRCACPGLRRVGERTCCARASAEDRMCDECREYCYAVDPRTGDRRPFAELIGPDRALKDAERPYITPAADFYIRAPAAVVPARTPDGDIAFHPLGPP